MATADRIRVKVGVYPFWTPRFWHGMRFGDYCRLMAENRCHVAPGRVAMAAILGLVTPFNSTMAAWQRWRFGKSIELTEVTQPPLFIVGHWRSGTTLLHELLVRDARFAYPTTFQCFAPHHFLVTEWFFTRFGKFLLPQRRPMDNMAAGWDHPQEDEFALLSLGVPTPYRRVAFPNHAPPDEEFLDMHDVPPAELRRWCGALEYFLKALTYHNEGRRVVLKSPPHTGRVGVLAEQFPGAQFVHITRHPYAIFASTRRLWKIMDEVQAFQRPRHERLDEYVFATLERMYAGFHRQREALAADQIIDVRYEQLVADPVEEIRRVYDAIGLERFADVQPKIQQYLDSQGEYRTNRHELDEQLKAQIRTRWADYFTRYGYDD